jgi:hypothetical protein
LAELNLSFGLMRQHKGKGRRYIDAALQYIGPPTISRLVRNMVIDGEGIHNALLMGPNARRINRSTLASATGSRPVTLTSLSYSRVSGGAAPIDAQCLMRAVPG